MCVQVRDPSLIAAQLSLVLLMAVLIPNLGILIALIGAISGSVLALILPALIDFRTPHRETTAVTQGLALCNVFFGVLGGIWGSALALQAVFSGDAVEG